MRPILQLGLLVVVVVAAAATVTRAEEQPNPVTEAEVTSNSNGPTEEPEEEVQVGMVGGERNIRNSIYAFLCVNFKQQIEASQPEKGDGRRDGTVGGSTLCVFVCCSACKYTDERHDLIIRPAVFVGLLSLCSRMKPPPRRWPDDRISEPNLCMCASVCVCVFFAHHHQTRARFVLTGVQPTLGWEGWWMDGIVAPQHPIETACFVM